MAKHNVRILNYNLTLTSDDDKTYIDTVAQRVERNIKTLSDNMPTRNMTEVALFVAMDYCDRFMKSQNDGSNMRSQIKDYLKDSSFARQQLEEAQKENELLKAENEKLRLRLAEERLPKIDAKDTENGKSEEISEDRSEKKLNSVESLFPAEPVLKETKSVPSEKELIFSRKKSSKGKKKENKQAAPIKGVFNEDAFSESADAAADIMSFFEEKSFEDDDD